MKRKIVLIGAGSVVFTQGLVMDMIKSPGGISWELALVDIDHNALDVAARLVKKMIESKEADITLSYSTDRRDVLADADYVVSTIGVGGRRAWEKDVYIPRKYGIFQPVGDSVMPGGISRAMRMIPATLGIVDDIMKLCPDAFFFNYSNPMNYICRAVKKARGFPVTGLCHGLNWTEGYLAHFAGYDRKRLTSYGVGLNHLTFIYDLRYDGKDAWPVIRERLEKAKSIGIDYASINSVWGAGMEDVNGLTDPLSWELFEDLGAFPAPGDRHVSEYFADRFPGGKFYGYTLGVDAYMFDKCIESGDEGYDEMSRLACSPEPLPEEYFQHFGGEHEQLVDIIASIEKDERKVFYANVQNHQAVPNLPEYSILEMPAVASAKGIIPIQLRDFPDTLAAIVLKHAAISEIVVEAALKGSRKLFAEAILMGGYTHDRNDVAKMVDELLESHKDYLPQFK